MSYEIELELSSDNVIIVDKIRTLIGDEKKVIHDYISTCKSRLSDDDCTVEMKSKGWPKSIYWNGVEETNSSGVTVRGYRYLTFSGSIVDTDVLDMYCYSFRNSDTEVHSTYNNAMIPPGLTATTVTSDHLILQAAIDLLEGELISDAVDSGVKIRDGDTTYDPEPSLEARQKILDRLRKRLDDLILQYMLNTDGILVD